MKRFLFIYIFLFLLLPFSVNAEDLISNAESGILIEANSGKIIFEKEKDKQLSVASMTKMVAQIIIMEEIEAKKIKWDDVVTVSKNASSMGGSQIYIEEGEKITVEDLMKGISIASGNDAVVAMAEYISGTEQKFVKRMNDKVTELGLKNTHFVNCTGLDEDNHYSSSYDMAIIARDLVINHSEILRFSSIYEDYLRQNTDRKFWLVNTNKLVSLYDGTDGLKAGHTDNAGYCLAATTKRDDLRLIAIVLGEDDSKVRNKETMELLDYGFNNVKLKKLKDKGEVVDKISLSKSNLKSLDVVLKDNLTVLEDIGDNNKYTYKVVLNNINLPILKNSVVGKINVLLNNKIVSSGDLIVLDNANKLSLPDLYISNLFNLVFGIL